MPRTLSDVRKEVEAGGIPWTEELASYALSQGAVDDSERGVAQPDTVDVSRLGGGTLSLLYPAVANLGASAVGGLSAGASESSFPTRTYKTGTAFGDFLANRAVPAAGQALGMGLGMAAMPGTLALRGAGPLTAIANRFLGLAPKMAVYGGARRGIEAARAGADPQTVVEEAGKGALRDAAISAPLALVPGGSDLLSRGLFGGTTMAGLAAAEGAPLADQAAAFLGGAGAAAATPHGIVRDPNRSFATDMETTRPLTSAITPVKPVPGNMIDAANIAYKHTGDVREYLKRLPVKKAKAPYLEARTPDELADVAPEVWSGILKGDKAAPPKNPVFDVKDPATGEPVKLPITVNGRLVEEKGTGKRFYVDSKGEYWEPIKDTWKAEEQMSPTGQMMAGVGGGRDVGPKGSENPAISHVHMVSEQAELNANKHADASRKQALKIMADTGVSDSDMPEMRRIGRIWKTINNDADLFKDPAALLLRPEIAEIAAKSKNPVKTVDAAQKLKSLIMEEFTFVNRVRERMGESPIGVQENYAPKLPATNWIQREFGVTPLFERQALGVQNENGGAPPWVERGAANPRAMSRKPGLEYKEEDRADVLLANYFHHMANEAFIGPAIKNARAVAKVYGKLGLSGSEANLNAYANHVLAGQNTALTDLVPDVLRGPLRRMSALQSGSVIGGFETAVTQVTGQVAQVGRHGWSSLGKAAVSTAQKPDVVKWMAANVPALERKLSKHGGISQQDISEFHNVLKDRTKWNEWFLNRVESALSLYSGISAHDRGIKRGLAPFSRELAEYISGEVKNIQGGYNRSERAGLVRDPEFGIFLGKFQGYAFQMLSQARSMALAKTRLGRTAYYRSEYAAKAGAEATTAKRLIAAASWVSAMAVANALTGNKKWTVGSVVPISSQLGVEDKRGAIRPYNIPKEFYDDAMKAVRDLVDRGSGRGLRRFVLRWRVPLGQHADKTIEGFNAWKRGGYYTVGKDGREQRLFTVEEDELLTVLLRGPYLSRGGIDYLAGREKGN